VHTGWAALVVAGGGSDEPVILARERVELLGPKERFVFHNAAELPPGEAQAWVNRAKKEATDRAIHVMRRLCRGDVTGRLPLCAPVNSI
jgi:hypothetical protein